MKNDFGATVNIEQDRSTSSRQENPNVITVQKDQIVQFQLAENGKEHEGKMLDRIEKLLPRQTTGSISNI